MSTVLERMKAKQKRKTVKPAKKTATRRRKKNEEEENEEEKNEEEENEEEENEEEENEEEENEEEEKPRKRRGPKPGSKRGPRRGPKAKANDAPTTMVKALLKEIEAKPASWELVDSLMSLVREEED